MTANGPWILDFYAVCYSITVISLSYPHPRTALLSFCLIFRAFPYTSRYFLRFFFAFSSPVILLCLILHPPCLTQSPLSSYLPSSLPSIPPSLHPSIPPPFLPSISTIAMVWSLSKAWSRISQTRYYVG